jgi:predicted dehydrogenase
MKIGIIGCGLIGRKRALSLESDDILIACCDINEELGKNFAKEFNCKYFTNYIDLLTETNCDIIIVAVVNKYAKDIVSYSLKLKLNVLVEKPMGINHEESLAMLKESLLNEKILKVGFNHRFHPAIMKAKTIFDSGEIGKILFIRAHYGHGGRNGMEKEWRSSKELCGGGELLDQGIHLIDLSRWFAGEIKSVFGRLSTKFWNIEVEDNAFILLKSYNDADIQLHASWTNWKNSYQFEIFGDCGYLKINGLGKYYGEETLEFGKRKENGGIPEIKIFNFDVEDKSWNREWKEFKSSIKDQRYPIGNAIDGIKASKIIDAIYESSSKNKVIEI